jgi:hypothetical protein
LTTQQGNIPASERIASWTADKLLDNVRSVREPPRGSQLELEAFAGARPSLPRFVVDWDFV